MRTDTTRDVKSLLEENIKLSKAILASTEKTRKTMGWMKIMSMLKLLVVVVPIILAIIYLPVYLGVITKSFGGLYGVDQADILNQFKNLGGGGISDILGGNK